VRAGKAEGKFKEDLEKELAKLQREARPDQRGRVAGVGLPLLQRQKVLAEQLQRIEVLLIRGKLDEAAKAIDTAAERYPELLLRVYKGQVHGRRAAGVAGADRFREQILFYRASAEAVDCPTMNPSGPHRREAAWVCFAVEADGDHAARLAPYRAAGAVGLAASGHPLAALAQALCIEEDSHLPRRAGEHHLRIISEPSGSWPDKYRAGLMPRLAETLDADEARFLLNRWVEDARRHKRQDLAPFRLLARLEEKHGDHRRALAWAERGLDVWPDDDELNEIAARARQRLGAGK
jgi:hypothetical protein